MLKEKTFFDLGKQIAVTGKLMQASFDNQVKQNSDLSVRHIFLMMVMKNEKVTTLEHISRDVMLFGKEVLETLSQIEAKGYVEHEDNNYSLTAAGKEVLNKLSPILDNIINQSLSSISNEEALLLRKLLEKVQLGCANLYEN